MSARWREDEEMVYLATVHHAYSFFVKKAAWKDPVWIFGLLDYFIDKPKTVYDQIKRFEIRGNNQHLINEYNFVNNLNNLLRLLPLELKSDEEFLKKLQRKLFALR